MTNSKFEEFRVDPNLWSTISHLNLKRLEVEESGQIDLLTIKQINDLAITQKVILAEEIEKCSNSDYLACSHLFDTKNPPGIKILG